MNVPAAAKGHITFIEHTALQINAHTDGPLTYIHKFQIGMPMRQEINIAHTP
ncbi:hypothetical protein D3C76_1727190 [compost metagenome]